jgi:hypothetical protein
MLFLLPFLPVIPFGNLLTSLFILFFFIKIISTLYHINQFLLSLKKKNWYGSLILHVSGVPRKGTPTSEMTRPKKKKAMILVSTNYCMGNYCMRKAKITISAL